MTGQHRDLVDPVLRLFAIRPDFDLDIMEPGQDLTDITSKVLLGLRNLFAAAARSDGYNLVLVQGDTTTTFAASLAAFYANIPVAHVEAGLRTGHMRSPFPEELNRTMVARLASLHFCPTKRAREALLAEGIDASTVYVTGNTGIDALHAALGLLKTRARPPSLERNDDAAYNRIADTEMGPMIDDTTLSTREPGQCPPEPFLPRHASKRIVVVTCHRRESFLGGTGLASICQALTTLARTREDIQIVFPVHPNPTLREGVRSWLASSPAVLLIEPLEYLSFVQLLDRAHIVITDSGGIQEEAPCLGKPVIVVRATTERAEAVDAGTVVVVGTDTDRIVREVTRLLDDENAYQAMARAVNHYGDGQATPRIMNALAERGFLRT